MPDIQEAKCFEFTVRIFLALRAHLAPPTFISVYALDTIIKALLNLRERKGGCVVIFVENPSKYYFIYLEITKQGKTCDLTQSFEIK